MKYILTFALAAILAACAPLGVYNPYAGIAPTGTPTVTAKAANLPISTPTPETLPALEEFCTVTASDFLNVRSGPGTNYPAISWLRSGETVTILDQAGRWLEIPGGWIHSEYCR